MFILTQYILKNSFFKNSLNLSVYTIVIGIVIYAIYYLYFMMYNRELLPYFNNIIIYILGVDLLLSAFYFQQSTIEDNNECKQINHDEFNYTMNENPNENEIVNENDNSDESDDESNSDDFKSESSETNNENLSNQDDSDNISEINDSNEDLNEGTNEDLNEGAEQQEIKIEEVKEVEMKQEYEEMKYQEFKNMIEMNKVKDSYEYTDDNSNVTPAKKRGRGRPKKE